MLRPRAHVIRYHGILGPAAKDRAQVVPRPGPVRLGGPKPVAAVEPRELDPGCVSRLNRLPWAVLLRRVFLVDVLECPKFGGRMKIIAAVTKPASMRRILEHLGLPSEAPELHPARPAPQLEMERAPAEAEDFHADPPGPDW